jgi:hypothetical protein
MTAMGVSWRFSAFANSKNSFATALELNGIGRIQAETSKLRVQPLETYCNAGFSVGFL